MRIDYAKTYPQAMRAMACLQGTVNESPIEPLLGELVKIRASQLNGCAHCLEMHTKDARALGERDGRLDLLAAWREAPVFNERERAALLWCEELTLLADTSVPDAVYEQVSAVFSEEEIVALTLGIVAINGWNRFAVALRAPVGGYVSPHGVARPATGSATD